MDPITHGVVGLAMAAFAGEAVSMVNPYAIGSLLGAVIPDADIVMQLKGDYSYLKNHRGMSHSIPFIFLYGTSITALLTFIYPGASMIKLFLYAVSGCISHLMLDITNSYGAQVLWPFYRKKVTLDLLLVYDPLLIILSLAIIIPNIRTKIHPIIALMIFAAYLSIRYWMKSHAKKIIKAHFNCSDEILFIRILPSMVGLVRWHFVIKAQGKRIIGEVNILPQKFRIIEVMDDLDNKLFKAVKNTNIAKFFGEFTPLFHIKCSKTNRGYEYSFTDLRYYIAKDFLHHATAVMDENFKLVNSVFHPYHRTRNVEI
ncbi:metal-dependent hydrolase [Lutispora sp.]|uniref:metal-dependent hydrolase n=1 Tax=Lutispora sp. TaxID=2828727 RepID=UPI002B1F3C31|nr:metal-dependent hydrolase [Lutispora sp.]MEA4960516.1 metal-dependent hydrolase [Lutispora sp.]